VRTAERGAQVTVYHAVPGAVADVRLGDAEAGPVGAVEVAAHRVPELLAGGDEGGGGRVHVPGEVDGHRAAGPVERPAAEDVVLDPPGHRQHVVPAPVLGALLAPAVVVGRVPVEPGEGVDRAAAAEAAAGRERDLAAARPGLRRGEVAVHGVRAEQPQRRPRRADHGGLQRGAGFQEQHLAARVLGQPGG